VHDLPDDDTWLLERRQVLADRVRAERLRQNLTQDQVWLAAGIDRRTYQHVEHASKDALLSTLLRIARALDVPLRDLVG